ncbi:MAG TPA: metallophosphoesterase [Ktedonobacteraceae bacterium]|nr:metallophosphoesterase [Ktedonobacteraceae bacterium]
MEDFTSLNLALGKASSAPLLYFWAFGDLHYRAQEDWHALHSRRLAPMFHDVRTLWLDDGPPAFCVSPGDIVDTGAPQNYTLARNDLAAQLANIPFYPGIGNHEFHRESRQDTIHTAAEYSAAWEKPLFYSWQIGQFDEITCIMLDQPDPYEDNPTRENPKVIFSPATLAFLDTTLEQHSGQVGNIAVIFAHCPLYNTVLDRDPDLNLDDDSLDPFFHVENSDEVRAILARHAHAAFYISGHTHSGWGSPNLITTEMLGGHPIHPVHPVTHVNLMSPWYTGRHRGPRLSADRLALEYYPDDPDVLISFAIRVYRHHAVIAARDHRAHRWLAQWIAPLL